MKTYAGLFYLGYLLGSIPVTLAQAVPVRMGFHFSRPALDVPDYQFAINDAGEGTYAALSKVESRADNQVSYTGQTKTEQPLSLSALMLARLSAAFQASKDLRNCASKAKNIADTGTKTLTLSGPGATVSCTYNYTEQKPIQELTTLFQGMAFTLDEARKLESKQKYDRLSLDAEMGVLVEAVKDGRALGLSNIRPTLKLLVDDPEVMGRVRTRAAKLLEQSATTP